MREDEYTEFKKTTGELNEAMVSISSILNKHHHRKVYFGLNKDIYWEDMELFHFCTRR